MCRAQRRRLAVAALAIVVPIVPLAGLTQPVGRGLRVAILDDASEKARLSSWRVFRSRLREVGYVEGKNLVIDARFARGVIDRLPGLAAELAALKPDVIVTVSTPATRAAMRATSSIPIVFAGVADPVAAGLVASLARPGGNATGSSIISTELGAKWVELLREIAPGAKRVAYLTNTSSEGAVLAYKRLAEQARKLDVAIEMLGGQDPTRLKQSLDAIARERFAGLIVGSSGILLEHREQIVQFAAQHKLPAVYGRREYTDAGGLLSYSADTTVTYLRAADHVQRIAQGAKPAEMPVERPNAVRLVINAKTSRALGIAIPQSISSRADELVD